MKTRITFIPHEGPAYIRVIEDDSLKVVKTVPMWDKPFEVLWNVVRQEALDNGLSVSEAQNLYKQKRKELLRRL